jgi:hypothetical protein
MTDETKGAPLTELIARIDALYREATPGPWSFERYQRCANEASNRVAGKLVGSSGLSPVAGSFAADTPDFLLAIVNAWPALHAELDRLTALVATEKGRADKAERERESMSNYGRMWHQAAEVVMVTLKLPLVALAPSRFMREARAYADAAEAALLSERELVKELREATIEQCAKVCDEWAAEYRSAADQWEKEGDEQNAARQRAHKVAALSLAYEIRALARSSSTSGTAKDD